MTNGDMLESGGPGVETMGPEGGRRPNGGTTVECSGPLMKGQRWTSSRKREVVLRILRGEPLNVLSRELGVEIYRLEQWRDAALAGMDEGLKSRIGDPLQAELDSAMKRIGELTMETELLWARVRHPGPLAKRRSKK